MAERAGLELTAYNQGLSDGRNGYKSDPGDFTGTMWEAYDQGFWVGRGRWLALPREGVR